MTKKDYVHWLPDEDYKKALWQARGQFNGIFAAFHSYGMDVFVPGAIEECMTILEAFGKRVRGKDTPIVVKRK